jgi:hypothetical protein
VPIVITNYDLNVALILYGANTIYNRVKFCVRNKYFNSPHSFYCYNDCA